MQVFDYEAAQKKGNVFGKNVIVEAEVELGWNNYFSDNCVIKSGTQIGDNNIFEVGSVVGVPSRERIMGPSHQKTIKPTPRVIIGNNNFFEAYSVIQSSLEDNTYIADHITVGAFSFIAHDTSLSYGVTISSHCSIGGYCIILECANLGMGTILHQRTVIGAFVMIGAGSVVINHIAPSAKVVGIPAHFIGVNRIGLERQKLADIDIKATDNWLRNECDSKLVPQYLIPYIKHFYDSILIWKREKAIIPCDNMH